jgi:UPF0042 nucleotide-binding protein
MPDIVVNIVSFGFKYGDIKDVNFLFDVRFLPNPFYIDQLRPKTGLDNEILNYIFSFSVSNDFFKNVLDIAVLSIDNFNKKGRKYITLAFGCTGGQHRSVAFAKSLYDCLKEKGYKTVLVHRDIEKDKKEHKI